MLIGSATSAQMRTIAFSGIRSQEVHIAYVRSGGSTSVCGAQPATRIRPYSRRSTCATEKSGGSTHELDGLLKTSYDHCSGPRAEPDVSENGTIQGDPPWVDLLSSRVCGCAGGRVDDAANVLVC